jgi:hypothetical protein
MIPTLAWMQFASIHCHTSLYTCPTFLLDSPFPRRCPTRQQQDYQANTVAVPTVRDVPNSTRSPLDFPISLPFPFRSLSSPINADVEADVGPTVSLSLSPSHQAVHSLDNPIAMRRALFCHSPSPAPHPPLSRAHSERTLHRRIWAGNGALPRPVAQPERIGGCDGDGACPTARRSVEGMDTEE